MKTLTAIGLMSGTSMDGVDAALLRTDGVANIEEQAFISLSYDNEFKLLLKAAEYAVKKACGDMQRAELNFADSLPVFLTEELNLSAQSVGTKLSDFARYLATDTLSLTSIIEKSTLLHADIVNKLLTQYRLKADQVDVIGYHGQTLYHHPAKEITVQIGDGQLLARRTGIAVVTNFRENDVKHGGQGAPFAPLYHHALAMRDSLLPTAVVNCGGIANVTIMPNDSLEDIIGFDTGPGNGLIDRLVKLKTQGREVMDTDGKYGAKGKISKACLHQLYYESCMINGENYYQCLPPKSLDIRDFQLPASLLDLSLADGCATLAYFTAQTITHSLDLLGNRSPVKTWITVGGGWLNPTIVNYFTECITQRDGNDVTLYRASDVGWQSQAIEAQVFAYLAVRHLHALALSFPSITGVPYPLKGGDFYR